MILHLKLWAILKISHFLKLTVVLKLQKINNYLIFLLTT